MTRPPRPLPAARCPTCHRTFPTIWAYKDHQDACIADRRRGQLADPPTPQEREPR